MGNKEQKKKIQIGIKSNFQRDKKGRIIIEGAVNEPIYADWTPELQKGQDEMFRNFAKFIVDEVIEYQKNGGDLSKLGTPDGDQHMKDYFQKKADEQKRKKELAQIKRKMTDGELEEFLKWKENNKKWFYLHQKILNDAIKMSQILDLLHQVW